MFKKGYLITLLLLLFNVAFAQKDSKAPVVIVSSYNPDVRNISENIDGFAKRLVDNKIDNPIKVENMNCRNLSECMEWEDRLHSLLDKYYMNGNKPATLVLFGAEASTAFFSMNDSNYKSTPVVIGMRSNNIVHLPDSNSVNLKTWNPQVHYLNKDYDDYNIVGGKVYEYDINKNIELLKRFYPNVDSLLFLSDNTLGGVTMRAHFVKCMRDYPKMSVELLDGRIMSYAEVDNKIAQVKGNKAIMIGTWRIDNTDSYAIANSTYSFGQSNPKLPAFSLSSVGMGHWAIGGYTPRYQSVGSNLADAVTNYLQTGKQQPLILIEQDYTFDYVKLQQFNIEESQLPENSIINNKPLSFFEEHLYVLLVVGCIIILLSLLVSYQRNEIQKRRKLQKQLEKRGKELEVAYEKAEKANAMKTEFIANMSHEIRTPLNAIVGFAQVLTDPDIENTREEKIEYGKYITSNSDLLLSLINEVLQISKIDTNNIKFNISDVDMCEICKLSVMSAKADLNSNVNMFAKVPDEPVYIKTDKHKIEQVLGNLLVNAKKFTDNGQISVILDASEDKEINISVTDTGQGVPADKAEQIFDRFTKLNAFKQGTGLGLSICKNLIEKLGGRIWLDTNYTGGARFVFTLPKS